METPRSKSPRTPGGGRTPSTGPSERGTTRKKRKVLTQKQANEQVKERVRRSRERKKAREAGSTPGYSASSTAKETIPRNTSPASRRQLYIPPSGRPKSKVPGQVESSSSDDEENPPGLLDGALPPLVAEALRPDPLAPASNSDSDDGGTTALVPSDSSFSLGGIGDEDQDSVPEQEAEGQEGEEERDQSQEEDRGATAEVPGREDGSISAKVGNFLQEVKGTHAVSDAALSRIYRFFCHEHAVEVARGATAGEFPQTFKTLKQRTQYNLPKTILRYWFMNDDLEEEEVDNRETVDEAMYKDPDRLLCLCAYNKLEDLVNFYQQIHEESDCYLGITFNSLELSSDGVDESKAGRRKLYLVSLRFQGCRSPVPWFVWEYSSLYAPTLEQVFRPIVEALERTGSYLERIVADGKEQHIIRGMTATNGFYGCARCLTKGTTERVRKVHYPYRIICPAKKTHQTWVDLFEKHADYFTSKENLDRTKNVRFGIDRRSPLLDIPGFDIVEDIPMDALHLLHLGITKKTWERIFEPKSAPQSAAARRKTLSGWNRKYTETAVPTEIRHKTKPEIKAAEMKGSDWQTVDTYCLVEFARDLEGPERLRVLLLTYSFIVRVCYSSDFVLQQVDMRLNLEKTVTDFYKLYAKVFGEDTLTFNLHSFFHIVDNRKRNGPMWQYSTFPYESMYAKIRQCYRVNTRNIPQQILQNYHAYQKHKHRCHSTPRLHFADRASVKTDDTLIYCKGDFFKILNVSDPVLTVRRLKTKALDTSALIKLPWSHVGVRVYQGTTSEEPITFNKDQVTAKAIICGTTISTMYAEWVVT